MTDKPINPSTYPSTIDLLVHAFAKFKQLYMEEGRAYQVFLNLAFAELETQEVNAEHYPAVTSQVAAEFTRAYLILSECRKKVILTFSQRDSFDAQAAAALLHACETRIPSVPKFIKINVATYETLAQVANRFRIFCPDITGADLLRFREGTLSHPLQVKSVSKAVFFLSLLAHHELLPMSWKAMAEDRAMLRSLRTGEVPSAKYMRNAASRYGVQNYVNVRRSTSRYIRLSWKDQLALSIRDAI